MSWNIGASQLDGMDIGASNGAPAPAYIDISGSGGGTGSGNGSLDVALTVYLISGSGGGLGGGNGTFVAEVISTITFPAVSRTDAGTYTCTFTNSFGSATSDPIVLTVQYIPVCTDHSPDQTVYQGTTVTLFATFDGLPTPTYQWYEDGSPISGETSSTIVVVTGVTTTYYCKATNVVGLGDSPSIVVTVIPADNPFEDLEIVIETGWDISVVHSTALDLMPLIPEKFRDSAILQAYVDEAELQFGDFLTKIRDIVLLLSPNTVTSITYLRFLGALIGVTFPPEDESSEGEYRKILSQAIEWYKIKGTYKSVQIIAMAQSFSVNLFDMYTDDYSTFLLTDWFVGEENENPPGLGSTYYKSPHFGIEVLLNQVYVVGSQNHLWSGSFLNNFAQQIEDTRPIQTVPHYILLLNPQTDEDGHVIEVAGDIEAKVTSNWQFSTKYFDAVSSAGIWSFDGLMVFDQSEELYIKSITTWVLGTGNPQINTPTPAIQTSVLTGSIDPDDITSDAEKYQFEFIVPKATLQDGITELGLYIPGTPTDQLVVVASFPKIDMDGQIEMRVVVQVFKKDLSI